MDVINNDAHHASVKTLEKYKIIDYQIFYNTHSYICCSVCYVNIFLYLSLSVIMYHVSIHESVQTLSMYYKLGMLEAIFV